MIERRLSISARHVVGGAGDGFAQDLGVAAAARAPEQHVEAAERLQRLVVQLARPAPALGLGCLQRMAQPLGLDGPGGRDGGRGARGERAHHLLVVVGEALLPRHPVERGQDAEGAPSVDERHQQRDRGIGDAKALGGIRSWDSTSSMRRGRSVSSTSPVVEPTSGIRRPPALRHLARGRGEHELVAFAQEHHDDCAPRRARGRA
jgi:hypothetical protein